MGDNPVPVLGQGARLVDCEQLTVAGQAVARQRITVSSPLNASGHAEVYNQAPVGTEYGLLIRPVRPPTPQTQVTTPVVVNFSAAGDNTVVAGVVGQTIRVRKAMLIVSPVSGSSTNAITFKDSTPTPFSGPMPFAGGGAIVLDLDGEPWYVTGLGQGFVINQTGMAQVSGTLWVDQS